MKIRLLKPYKGHSVGEIIKVAAKEGRELVERQVAYVDRMIINFRHK